MNISILVFLIICFFLKIVEVFFWISYILSFIELRLIDYETYTSKGGAGWAQVFFILTSGIIFKFCYKREWIKLIISLVIMGLIIASTGVRSLMFFIIIPSAFYYLYKSLHTSKNEKQFFIRTTPLIFVVILSVILVNMLRFGVVKMPETELTKIAFHCMEQWNFGLQYFSSVFHYVLGILTPINNLLMKMGIFWLDFLQNLLPSIPKLNALIYANAQDVSEIGAYHMPATIFYNFYMSWGSFSCVFAFFTYWFFIKIFRAFQKNIYRILIFSPMLGWHFYMIMRGASDGAAKGVAYSLLLGIIICFIVEKKKQFQNYEKHFTNNSHITRYNSKGFL